MATVYKRGKQWWGRVQREGEDLRQPLKTTIERVARERLAEWLEEIDRVSRGGKPRRTFDETMLRFVDEHLPTIKVNSRKRYLISIAALTDVFEGMWLNEITSSKLSDFEAARRKAGCRIPEKLIGKQRPRPISPATIRRDLACLSSMFGCAMEWEWAEFNPVPAYLKSRKKRGLRESPARTRYLTHDEEARLLAVSRGANVTPDLYEAICVAIDTGMRKEELLALTHGQVNLRRNQIELTENSTKNSKARNIPLEGRSAQILAQKPPHVRSPFVFTNPETGLRYTQLGKGLAGACKRAGIIGLRWHDLRRTCGCRLLQDRGFSIKQVSEWLGHSSSEVTEKRYAFLKAEALHDALRAGTTPGTGATDSSAKDKEIK